MIDGKQQREPHIVVYLNVERGSKGVPQGSMQMIQVTKVRGIDGCTR
jgi:hypothetical protein